MPEDDHSEHDDHGDHPHIHGFAALPLGEMLGVARHEHDRAQIRSAEMRATIFGFLDGLDVDQLRALRLILNMCGDSDRELSEFFDGQVVSIMRLVHHVNPDTGQSLEEELAGKDVSPPPSS